MCCDFFHSNCHRRGSFGKYYIGVKNKSGKYRDAIQFNIWRDGKFVASSICKCTKIENLPIKVRTELKGKCGRVYMLSINPDYIKGSWLSYYIEGDDGFNSLECVIKLADHESS